jgi:uncharacterized protein (TIGR02611 family)
VAIKTIQRAKRWIKMIVGFTLLVFGAAMLVLPGPGIVTIVLGLAILGTEYVWARLLLEQIKRRAAAARDAVRRRGSG